MSVSNYNQPIAINYSLAKCYNYFTIELSFPEDMSILARLEPSGSCEGYFTYVGLTNVILLITPESKCIKSSETVNMITRKGFDRCLPLHKTPLAESYCTLAMTLLLQMQSPEDCFGLQR